MGKSIHVKADFFFFIFFPFTNVWQFKTTHLILSNIADSDHYVAQWSHRRSRKIIRPHLRAPHKTGLKFSSRWLVLSSHSDVRSELDKELLLWSFDAWWCLRTGQHLHDDAAGVCTCGYSIHTTGWQCYKYRYQHFLLMSATVMSKKCWSPKSSAVAL